MYVMEELANTVCHCTVFDVYVCVPPYSMAVCTTVLDGCVPLYSMAVCTTILHGCVYQCVFTSGMLCPLWSQDVASTPCCLNPVIGYSMSLGGLRVT